MLCENPSCSASLSAVGQVFKKILVILVWYVIVALNFIFLMINDTEPLFMCLFAVHMLFFGEYLFRPFAR